jgi:1,2-dihydroxy-3-keto-5-methylthiopentene dioxygenase
VLRKRASSSRASLARRKFRFALAESFVSSVAMSLLVQLGETDPARVILRSASFERIRHALDLVGVRFERWTATHPLSEGSMPEEVLRAYASDIERLKRERGYRSADVVRLKRDPADPAWSEKAHAARGKFLEEHTHAEDEVRFFVEGTGLFCLRLAGDVYLVRCESGDLLSVPAGTRHWFDMGSEPAFSAIRLFGSEAGWVAEFTGDDIARRFPTHDLVVQTWV